MVCATCATGLRVVEFKDWSPGRQTGHHIAAVPQGYICLQTHTHQSKTACLNNSVSLDSICLSVY